VTEFIYRYNAADRAHVFLSFILQTSNRAHEVADVLERLAKEDMQGVDISDDELAKAHGRYLAGGRADVEHERVFRFGKCMNVCGGDLSPEGACVDAWADICSPSPPSILTEFPERPGALRKFLQGMRSGWNISLFHYRNHGAGA